MTSYQNVIDKIRQNNLSWDEIDRILLNSDNYEEMQDRASFQTSNYATNDAPAVRKTGGDEKIVFVAANGAEVTIEL